MKENRSDNTGTANQNKDDSFFGKARKMMTVYFQSTGSKVCVYDNNYMPIPELPGGPGIEETICQYCSGCSLAAEDGESAAKGERHRSCREMHINAIREASRQGGSYIYRCELGLMFWISPIYSEGRFTGALRGSGYLNEAADPAVFPAKHKGEITPEEFVKRVSAFPVGDGEKIKSLAEMLLICAESLSSGSEDYHEILRRRSEQQKLISAIIEDLRTKYPEGSILPGYPLDRERQLIAALRRGDSKVSLGILNELLAILIFSNPNHFKYIQLRALELVVLLSRVGSGNSGNLTLETNARSLKRIQDAKTIEELTDILHSIVERIAGQISSFQGIPHATAMRKAERYIQENFTRKLSLQEIAKVAGLSAPYFSTLFKEEMGENLSKYLNRLRVEKASRLLLESDLSLSEIAGACCFEDQSWFSKIFKIFTGLSPGKYRSQGGGMVREISEHNLSEDYLKTIK